ncbi:hypothetical protein [Salimicrobium flavidum]|uniref:Phage abortive infection protein n=1 Tax=Salimicrobium flavidum TaxID=570947 RepID=A0A1N7J2B6_9BACI|nr:hypothetical protein [Salimicrobium flavidum]SIS43483.1 hypothetical protein SAMN05421687_103238 [Salimicrobium flavidum]
MKKVIIILALVLFPLIMSLLIKVPLFNFSSGTTDSWIGFWGSYLGALVGAGTVYMVTNIQIQEQRKIQLESIREEHYNALKREMKQYHFRNQIDKIEDFNETIEEFLDTLTKCSNDFTKYITYTHILYGEQDNYTKEEETKYKEEIKELKDELYNWIHRLNRLNFRINRLSLYIEDTSSYTKSISSQLVEFVDELKSGYRDDYSFKKYLDFNQASLNHHLEQFMGLTSQLLNNVLQPKLEQKINEMNSGEM